MVDAEVHQIIGIGADLAVLGVSDSGFVGFIVGKGMKGEIIHMTMWELCNILGLNESLCQFNPVYTWSIRSH